MSSLKKIKLTNENHFTFWYGDIIYSGEIEAQLGILLGLPES